jgi:hypothetical protein
MSSQHDAVGPTRIPPRGRPDMASVLSGLKDFQRDTVDYVFEQLYGNGSSGKRFLVADEVGLGKTMVAKGLIARAIDHLWGRTDRIDIIYICSNADIARQNINRLNVTGRRDFGHASRITLLPVTIQDLKKNPVNFISFTPGTSFDLKSSLGVASERALLHRLLEKPWALEGDGPVYLLQGLTKTENFRWSLWDCRRQAIDTTLCEAFERRLSQQPDLRRRFSDLSSHLEAHSGQLDDWARSERASLVGDLRNCLAVACLDALKPDLIILDEFQRFKDLLDGNDQASELARHLFQCAGARVLLLSATPYKMYTLSEEKDAEDGEDHYRDFLRTVRFLEDDAQRTTEFEGMLNTYRRSLLQLGTNELSTLSALRGQKHEIEQRLRRVMSRTERLTASDNRNGMLEVIPPRGARLEASDVKDYLSLQDIGRVLGDGDTLEYWKSAPYLLNFMDGYKFKRNFASGITHPETQDKIAAILATSGSLLLPWREISKYQRLEAGNARLRSLLADTLDAGMWRLLWMPPALDYYQLGGPYAEAGVRRLTKRLVFSSWQVVPKVIAAMLSYEAERRMIRSHEDDPEPFEERAKRRPLLRFARTEGRLTGMPVLALLYPCFTLAAYYDPLDEGTAAARAGRSMPTLLELITQMEQRISSMLADVLPPQTDASTEDEQWYWAAPLLLDLHFDGAATRDWLQQPQLAEKWIGMEDANGDDPADEDASLWAEHVHQVLRLADGSLLLGRPPADLVRVLALLAIAGPGVTALRSLSRISGGPNAIGGETRSGAARVAWSFRRLYNLPEAMAIIRGLSLDSGMQRQHRPGRRDFPYWRQTLEYGAAGGIQMVLDEYAHVLRDSLGLIGKPPEVVVKGVSLEMGRALTLRTVNASIDDIIVTDDEQGGPTVQVANRRMRGHFALRFGEERSDDGKNVLRAEQVRIAFNSPFWPFVLASTSVGQEGLDFHLYCHAVVHWNLPSNPVDLEQREGRVHRYKGHAIRKNVARQYGLSGASAQAADPWAEIFARAEQDRPAGAMDIFPFWIYECEDGAKIERHVPVLPLSKDSQRLESLRHSLALYRMVFGQARQEDLLASLQRYLSQLPHSEAENLMSELRINLEPPHPTRDA